MRFAVSELEENKKTTDNACRSLRHDRNGMLMLAKYGMAA